MMTSFFETVKIIVGKEENAGYLHFLLFLTMFLISPLLQDYQQEGHDIKALALTVWDKKIFKDFLLYLYVKSENPQHRTNFYSRAII